MHESQCKYLHHFATFVNPKGLNGFKIALCCLCVRKSEKMLTVAWQCCFSSEHPHLSFANQTQLSSTQFNHSECDTAPR